MFSGCVILVILVFRVRVVVLGVGIRQVLVGFGVTGEFSCLGRVFWNFIGFAAWVCFRPVCL